MFLGVSVHTLHAQELVAGEAEFFVISVGMLATHKRIQGLRIVLKETWVVVGSAFFAHWFLIRGYQLKAIMIKFLPCA